MPKVNAKEKLTPVEKVSPFVKSSVRKIRTGYRAVGEFENGFKVVRESSSKDAARLAIESVGAAIADHASHVKAMAAAARRIARAAKKAKG